LLQQYKIKHNKDLTPVKHRKQHNIPDNIFCPYCKADKNFIYLNNGKKASQFKCKVCSHTFHLNLNPDKINNIFLCPYCEKPLEKWKTNKDNSITKYKCRNNDCPFYTNKINSFNDSEKELFEKAPYKFNVRYIYRDYNININKLKVSAPNSLLQHFLNKKHFSDFILSIILTLFVSYAISSRKTAQLIKDIFNVNISHQTVINYAKAVAPLAHKFNLFYKPSFDSNKIVADETYIKIKKIIHYVWFFISLPSKAIISYHVSDSRNSINALTGIIEAIKKQFNKFILLFADGNPAYNAAAIFLNTILQNKNRKIKVFNIIGLQNNDKISTAFRPLKQTIERLNRSFKHHYKVAHTFNNYNGATAFVALFVTHYNFIRPHYSLGRKTPIEIKQLKNLSTPKKWLKIIELATIIDNNSNKQLNKAA
jgi:putative transposase